MTPSIKISTTVPKEIFDYHLRTQVKYSDLIKIGYNQVSGEAEIPSRLDGRPEELRERIHKLTRLVDKLSNELHKARKQKP